VVLIVAETFGGRGGTDQLATSLKGQGVPLRLIDCGVELAEALSGFMVTNFAQDVVRWQRPTLSHLT
jgi:hypothetical protein